MHAQNSVVDEIIIEPNNFSGGGFQSDVTITEDGQTVYSSADVSGIFKSTNGGESYVNINKGLQSPKVASLAITPDNEQILYAGTGDKGVTGGLFRRSMADGDTWVLTDAGESAKFAGNHSLQSHPVPDGHARSNGDLIIVVPGDNPATHSDDIVIAGTYKDGVRLFSAGGDIEESAVNTEGFVRSVAYHPDVPKVVYAAIYFPEIEDGVPSEENGIYKIEYGAPYSISSPNSTHVYSTPNPEGLTALSNGKVYAAVGMQGIAKFNGSTWVLKNNGLDVGNPLRHWTAVAGYLKGTNNDVIYAGLINDGGNAEGEDYSSIWKTINGGNTWEPMVDEDSVDEIICGQTNQWWVSDKGFPNARLGLKKSVVSSIAVSRGPWYDITTDDIIYVSGRGGIWKSDNGGDTWKPAVHNMQATANVDVAVNPDDPSQVVIANTDYVVMQSGDRFDNNDMSRDKPSGAESRAYDIVFDPDSNVVIAGVGKRDNNNQAGGEVYVKSADKLGNPSDSEWIPTHLINETSSNDGRIRAVTYGYHDGTGGTTQTILAVVEGQGVFRYHEGEWNQSNGVNIGSTDNSAFVWPDNGNSGVVYLLDLDIGLYRSMDGGENWTDIWPDVELTNNDFYNLGYITADDNDPTTLYISLHIIGTGFKVYRMTDAHTGEFGPPGSAGIEDIGYYDSGNSSINRPGPIDFGPDGRLWLTQQQHSPSSNYAGLFVMENPRTDMSFTDLTTDEYQDFATTPSGMDVSDDGYIYIAQSGNGLVKIRYTEKTSDITPSMTMIPSTANGTTDVYFTIQTQELEGLATLGDITIVFPKDPRMTIDWKPSETSIGPFTVDNSSWTYDGSNPNFHIWTSSTVIPAAGSSVFGFSSIYDPQNTSGKVSYTGTIILNSGGEINGLNNIDAETIIYFSN